MPGLGNTTFNRGRKLVSLLGRALVGDAANPEESPLPAGAEGRW